MNSAINPELRFDSIEQHELFCKTRDIRDSVPPFIQQDGQIVVNPAYTKAPYCERYVFMDRRRFKLEDKDRE